MLQARARQMSGEATPPPQPDESPIDTSTSAVKLEKSLKQRPDEKELKERNILKGVFYQHNRRIWARKVNQG
jgi:RPEL repeat